MPGQQDDRKNDRSNQPLAARRPDAGRREFLRLAGLSTVAAATASRWFDAVATAAEPASTPSAWPGTLKLPEKTDLLLQSDRPPNLETPLKYFREDFTPNEAFYVRWHLSILPTRIDPAAFRLSVGGHVENALSLSLDDLRTHFEPVSVVAVNQCSGNSRSKYSPRMPGVQWGNGAIGNAKWTGVRLGDVLSKAGLKAGAIDISFNGLDGPALPAAPGFAGTPDFVKSLAVNHANDGEVMIAYEMNGQPLPMLNGFPLRLVVPGWYATYWVKALNEITVLDKPFDGFWMAKAYRVPNTPDFQEDPKALAKETVPINRMSLRSLFVAPEPSETIPAGAAYEVQGLAIDGGHGMKSIEVSTDGGGTWSPGQFDPELGLLLAAMAFHLETDARPIRADGPSHQPGRPGPGAGAMESQRLCKKRDRISRGDCGMKYARSKGPMKPAIIAAIALCLLAGAVVRQRGLMAQQPQPRSTASTAPTRKDVVRKLVLPEIDPSLPPEKGVETVRTNCGVCHTPHYILNQPPLSRAAWTAEVSKMQKSFSAPIPPESLPVIMAYLMKVRGTGE